MTNYKLYTLVDITHTNQYRSEPGKEVEKAKEQNFNTVLQTLGIRSNIYYHNAPSPTEVKGSVVGFNTDKIIRVWRFDFETDHSDVYEKNGDPVGLLIDDFHLIPYIAGLDEKMTQRHPVFTTVGKGKNIVFFQINLNIE